MFLGSWWLFKYLENTLFLSSIREMGIKTPLHYWFFRLENSRHHSIHGIVQSIRNPRQSISESTRFFLFFFFFFKKKGFKEYLVQQTPKISRPITTVIAVLSLQFEKRNFDEASFKFLICHILSSELIDR